MACSVTYSSRTASALRGELLGDFRVKELAGAETAFGQLAPWVSLPPVRSKVDRMV